MVSNFFKHGNVVLNQIDAKKNLASISICMPCSLFQACSPVLLKNGLVSDLEISDVLSVWIPDIANEDICPTSRHVKDIREIMNRGVEFEVSRVINLYKELSKHLSNPSHLIPLLPLGTYINFAYSFEVIKSVELLQDISSVNVSGVIDFSVSFSEVLQYIIINHTNRT